MAKGLAGGYAARTLFEGLDLTVAPGEVIGVNGAGKSTLLRTLLAKFELKADHVSRPVDDFVGVETTTVYTGKSDQPALMLRLAARSKEPAALCFWAMRRTGGGAVHSGTPCSRNAQRAG